MEYSTKQKGNITEIQCALAFMKMGYKVSFPYGEDCKYDMIVDTDTDCYRIQVKHASLNDNGSYTVNTSNTVSTTTKNARKYYSKNDVDFIVSIIEDQLVVIPVEMIEHTQSKIFRTVLPKHGVKSTCNLIEDFTAERYIL